MQTSQTDYGNTAGIPSTSGLYDVLNKAIDVYGGYKQQKLQAKIAGAQQRQADTLLAVEKQSNINARMLSSTPIGNTGLSYNATMLTISLAMLAIAGYAAFLKR